MAATTESAPRKEEFDGTITYDDDDDDELESKERVIRKYFLQEWNSFSPFSTSFPMNTSPIYHLSTRSDPLNAKNEKKSPINAVELYSSTILDDEDMEVPEIIEEIIAMLLTGLKDTDKGLGELAADALSGFVKYDLENFGNYAIEKSISYTLSFDLCMRHGATLAVGEVVSYYINVDTFFPLIYVNVFLALLEETKRTLLDALNENLRHTNSQIQNAVVKSLQPFVPAYLAAAYVGKSGNITTKYFEIVSDPT